MSPSISRRGCLLAGLFLLLAAAAFGSEMKDEWLAQTWQTEEGLSDNSVDGLAQTTDGYLWVGTPTGLARLDGLRFENISLTNIIALPNHGIVTMVRGRENSLWLAMDRGAVVRLSGKTSRAFVQELPDYIPNGMAEDGEGSLWVAYRSGTVYRIKDDRVVPLSTAQGLPAGPDICALTVDNAGRLWFAKAGRVEVFSNEVFRVMHRFEVGPAHSAVSESMRLAASAHGGIWVCCGFHIYKIDGRGEFQDFGEFHPENPGTIVTVMIEDHTGSLWIGTSFNGLYRCTPDGFQAIPTSHSGILSLTEDREGNIWVGTSGGGLNRIRRRAIDLEGAATGLPFPSIQSMCEATDGTIWAATQNGVLVHQVEGRWNSIPVTSEWPGGATCVTADPRGAVWIGTRQGRGLYCWQGGAFTDWGDTNLTTGKTLHTLVVSRTGDLWMAGESPNALLRLRNGKITPFPVSTDYRIIRAMTEDRAGNIWVGTSRGNLLCISGDKLTEVAPRPAQEPASIRCLYATPDGALWIGYAGWGVGCLKDGHYSEVSTAQGLFDDYVSHIVADDQGWIWFGANRGIFKVRQRDFEDLAAGRNSRVRSFHYGRDDGLPSLQATFGDAPDVLRSHDGRLWIPMQTALVVVDPAKLYDNTESPQTLLTRVLVDNRVAAEYESVLPPNPNGGAEIPGRGAKNLTLHLPSAHRSIQFQFAAFSFTAPENIQFRHQLKGFEDEWMDGGQTRSVTYPQLNSGTYTFQVAACNGDGDWDNTGAQITLEVPPFFWATWWFRLGVVVAFTACVITIVRYISFRRLRARLRVLEQQAALQRERARIAKDIHDDLGANLTQIAYLGELANQDRGEPNLVGERIGTISATARQAVKSLDEIVWAVNPRNDTLAHLLDYAGQYTVDYLRTIGIRCRLDFPVEIPARELSTELRHNLFLVIKEALHNIFKHAGASEVWLRATADGVALHLEIEDNGRGFATAPNDALADGLRNMRQRMEEISGEFHVASRPGGGTKITLHLPWLAPTPNIRSIA